MGPAGCHPVSGKEAVLDLVRRHELKGITLTDGLHNMARFENDVISKTGNSGNLKINGLPEPHI